MKGERGMAGLVGAALAVGALAGVLSAAFHVTLDAAVAYRNGLAATTADSTFGWLLPVTLAAGCAFAARWLVRRFAPETSGSGVQLVEAIVRGESGRLRAAALPVKFAGGVLAIGSGFALGREGPTVQMSATLAQLLARAFRFGDADARVLLAAGAGAGLAAAFNAPLAGAIFVFEEIVGALSARVAVAALAATSAALAVTRTLIGDRLVFEMPSPAVELFPGYFEILAFGAVIGLLGVAYNRLVIAGLDLAERMARVPPEWRAAAVGALVGWLCWYSPGMVGSGEEQVQAVLNGAYPLGVLVALFAVRLALGPLSYAPGLPGGLFAPLLIVGATAGALFGTAAHALNPHITTPVAAFAAVGMGALFTAVVRAPLTGIALVIEMTGATGIFIPLLTACIGAVAVPAALGCEPIYDSLRRRGAALHPPPSKPGSLNGPT